MLIKTSNLSYSLRTWIIVLFFALKCIVSEDLTCDFKLKFEVYACTIRNQKLNNNEINVIGDHLENFNRSNVHLVAFIETQSSFIPNGLFKEFRMLIYLWMQQVGLESIDKNSFLDAANLTEIKLTRNLIESLPIRAFASCINLVNLYLQANKIKEIAENAFEGLNQLENILLNNNMIEMLPEKIFETNTNLQRVDLNHNLIKNVDGDLFARNVNLKKVYLNNNQLKELTSTFFSNNVELEHIYLEFNEIDQLQAEVFQNNSKLTTLSCSNNKIRDLPQRIFWNNIILEFIDFSYNQIEWVMDLFESKINLKTLLFSNNAITAIHSSFLNQLKTNTLLTLDLRENICVNITRKVSDLELGNALENCTGNFQIIVCEFIADLEYYKCLLNNGITINLEQINFFSGNHEPGKTNDDVSVFESNDSNFPIILPAIFTTFKNIEKLVMVKVNLLNLQGLLCSEKLTDINFEYNKITELLDDTFVGCTALKTISFHDNQIAQISDNSFAEAPLLIEINLSNNKIQELTEQTFSENLNLEVIILHTNSIEIVGDWFFNNKNLILLDLSNNHINSIDSSLFRNFKSLENLYLSSNYCIDENFLTINNNFDNIISIIEVSCAFVKNKM